MGVDCAELACCLSVLKSVLACFSSKVDRPWLGTHPLPCNCNLWWRFASTPNLHWRIYMSLNLTLCRLTTDSTIKMGLTKQYLRYAAASVFNVVASQRSNVVFLELKDQKGKYCAVAACEHVFIWDLRKAEKVLNYITHQTSNTSVLLLVCNVCITMST